MQFSASRVTLKHISREVNSEPVMNMSESKEGRLMDNTKNKPAPAQPNYFVASRVTLPLSGCYEILHAYSEVTFIIFTETQS